MVRVGLVGFGFASQTFHAPLIGAVEGMEIVAVSSSDAARVHGVLPGVAVEADPFALVARHDVDLVVVASPNDSHAPIASTALAAGKHVVVDKPFTVTLDEARGLIAQAETAGRLLSVFHNRRWDSDFLSVKAAIEDGVVGRVTQFVSHFDRFRPEVRDRWREKAGPGSGIWFDLGPHLADQALCLFGLPDWVSGDIAIQRGGGADDWVQVVLGYGPMRVMLCGSMLVAGGTARFTVHGIGGSLVKAWLDQQEAQLIAGVAPGSAEWGRGDDPVTVFDGAGSRTLAAARGDQTRYYAGIRNAISGVGANPVPGVEALAVMAVIEAGERSSRTGARVELALSAAERVAYAESRT
ncbi:oxidoreductase [Sphingomonas sp. LT1P40]|uniref:oxidoreductase n=1 Tax=Alteristakelama amylovorans TaxID=3096166 RepID=UPI002FCA24D5